MSGSPGDRQQARWRQAPHVLWRRLFDGAIFLPLTGEAPIRTTTTGAALWYALDEPRTVEEVTELLAAAFSAIPGEVERDVLAALDEFERIGMVDRLADGDVPCPARS